MIFILLEWKTTSSSNIVTLIFQTLVYFTNVFLDKTIFQKIAMAMEMTLANILEWYGGLYFLSQDSNIPKCG